MKEILAKEKVKGMIKKTITSGSSWKQLDTIVGPQNKHTIVDQGCSWTTPLKNCLGAVFIGF